MQSAPSRPTCTRSSDASWAVRSATSPPSCQPPTKQCASTWPARLAELEHQLAEICREAAADNTLREGIDPDKLAHALFAHYQGLILLAKLHGSSASALAPRTTLLTAIWPTNTGGMSSVR